jgi:hypothetical protein
MHLDTLSLLVIHIEVPSTEDTRCFQDTNLLTMFEIQAKLQDYT